MLSRQEFGQMLVEQMPALKRRAISLSRDRYRSEDLVQIAVLKAWEHQHRFQEGSCLRAWLFTILRNAFITGIRSQRREVADTDDQFSALVMVPASQDDALTLKQVLSEIQTLPDAQRRALMHMGVDGYSQREAATASGCSLGTIKSRVSRARAALGHLLDDATPAVPVRAKRVLHEMA